MSVIPVAHLDSKWEMAKYLGTILIQCILYFFIASICVVAGFIANPHTGAADIDSLLDKLIHALDTQDASSAAIASGLFFTLYFLARLLLIDRPPSLLNQSAITASLVSAGIFYGLFALLGGAAHFHYGVFRTFVLVFCVTLPSATIFFRSVVPQQDHDHHTAHNFLPKIFFPAFSVCYFCFLLGWSWADPIGTPKWLGLNSGELVYCALAVMLTVMFLCSFADSANTPKIVFIVFSTLLLSTILATIFLYKLIGLALFIALLWSFALGVPEVAKRGHLLATGKVMAGTGETPLFFVAGANWSSILFFNLLFLMPILIANTAMLFVVGIVWLLLLTWHLIANKSSALAYSAAIIMGFALPLSMVALFLLGNVPVVTVPLPATTANQTDRLVTLLGIFLTIIFVLYHDRYRKMPDELRASFDWFLTKQGCLLFAALIVAAQAAFVTLIFAILSVSEGSQEKLGRIQVQVDWILIALIVELLFVLVFLFIAKDEAGPQSSSSPSKPLLVAPEAAAKKNDPIVPAREATAGTSATKHESVMRLANALLHPLNSTIAGLLSFVIALQNHAGAPLYALLIFASVTALCMFGYVMNDIFDVEKDRLANRTDKPTVTGLISLKSAIKLAVALAVISLFASAQAGIGVASVVVVGLMLCTGYSYFSRVLPKLKGLYTGILCCLPVIAGSDLAPTIGHLSFLFVIVVFIFGREIVIDVTDMNYDQSSRHNTIALSLGTDRALLFGWAVMLSSAPLMYFVQTSLVGRMLVILAIVSLFGILSFSFRDAERSIALSRIPMLLIIGSFLYLS